MSHFDAEADTPRDLPSHVFLLEEWAGHPPAACSRPTTTSSASSTSKV